MMNDWFSSIDEICADNYNFSQFKLKGTFHCDAEAGDGVERLQEITAHLLVCGDGKLRSMAENICSLTQAVSTTAPRGDFYGGYIPCQSHLFYFLYPTPRLQSALLSMTLSGIKKDGKQLLPDYDKFIPFDAPNHDDWNDLFNDLVKLEDKLTLSDSRKFSMSDLAVRFRLMHTVDSLEPPHGSKMHRELLSMRGLSASTHRFWFLHILMFALSMSWAARDDLSHAVLSGGDVRFAGSSQCVLIRNWAFKKNCGYAVGVSAALLVSGPCPCTPTSSYAVSE